MTVLSNGYPSEYGRAAGGVTLVEMRPGTDLFHVNVNSFNPRLHFASGRIDGVEAWEPNFGMSGPIVKGRVWFTEGADYRYVRNYYDTVAGPQANKYTAVLSWTSIDWSLSSESPRHRLGERRSADDRSRERRRSSRRRRRCRGSGAADRAARSTDRLVLGADTTLESSVQAANLPTAVTSAGVQPYAIGHDVARGDYFNQQNRTASRVELSETYTHGFARGASRHLVKAGGAPRVARLRRRRTRAAIVSELRSDGTLARADRVLGQPASGRRTATSRRSSCRTRGRRSRPFRSKRACATTRRRSPTAASLAPRLGVTWTIDEQDDGQRGRGRLRGQGDAGRGGVSRHAVADHRRIRRDGRAPRSRPTDLRERAQRTAADAASGILARADRSALRNGWIARLSLPGSRRLGRAGDRSGALTRPARARSSCRATAARARAAWRRPSAIDRGRAASRCTCPTCARRRPAT